MKKVLILLITIFISSFTFSQNKSVNEYKYVVVPSTYNFLNEADQYQLNSFTKFLFNKYGFKALLDTEQIPNDGAVNNCLVLKSNVIREKAFLRTKLVVELKNCRGEVVHISGAGESKEKNFQKAYHEALRAAFTSIQALNYRYNPKTAEISSEEVKEQETLNNTDTEPEVKEQEIKVDEEKTVVQELDEVTTDVKTPNILYAQPTDEGYQLVDTTPKVIYNLIETQVKGVFIVKDKNALLYQKDGNWFIAYSKTNTTKLNIKF